MTWLLFRIRWWRWFFDKPYRLGDPMLGGTREMRNRNMRILDDRWHAREPKLGHAEHVSFWRIWGIACVVVIALCALISAVS